MIIAAQKATTTIPIVMVSSIDPVEAGFVKSLAHPGGNITGISNFSGELSPKHLELLLTMVPKLSRVAVGRERLRGGGVVELHLQVACPADHVVVGQDQAVGGQDDPGTLTGAAGRGRHPGAGP